MLCCLADSYTHQSLTAKVVQKTRNVHVQPEDSVQQSGADSDFPAHFSIKLRWYACVVHAYHVVYALT